MMMIPPQQGPAPVLNQSPQASLAGLLAPAPRPASSAPLIDPSKMMDMVKLARSLRDDGQPYQGPATDPSISNADLSGNVMDPNKPGGRLANGLFGSEGLFGSNGFVQRQFGAQPSAVNAYNGPAIGADPASAMMTSSGFRGG